MKRKRAVMEHSTFIFATLFVANVIISPFIIPRLFMELSFRKQTIKISGNVNFKNSKNYKDKTMIVNVKSEKNFLEGLPPDIASSTASPSGKFSLRVPKMVGKVYLETICFINDKKNIASRSDISPKVFYGLYLGNPLEVKIEEFNNINIDIFDTKGKNEAAPVMLQYDGPTVNISGEVTFEGYKRGIILVMARRSLQINSGVPDINYTMLLKPGKYTLAVPKEAGKIYIDAVNLTDERDNLRTTNRVSHGYYEGNPIRVGASDVNNVNIALNPIQNLAMDSYTGHTVKLSGNVMYDEYEGGIIVVSAKSKQSFERALPPDIAIIEMPSPGKYTLYVPAKIGEVYIDAVNISGKEDRLNLMPTPSVPHGRFRDNPVIIGTYNLDNIDIVLSKKSFPIMDTYKSATVEIAGEVIYKNYKEGAILIILTDMFDKDIDIVEMDKPGKFKVYVPKNIGSVYIEALNVPDKFRNFKIDGYKRIFFIPNGPAYDGKIGRSRKALPDIPFGTYLKNPIKVGSDAIKNVKISLLEKHFALMDTYKGAAVNISGRVSFKNFKDWKDKAILISARTKRYYELYCEPDIAYTKIFSTGNYSLKVPKGAGELYMDAVIVDKGDKLIEPPPDAPYGKYIKNPIQIGLKNMEHIDIDLTSTYGKR